MAASVHVDLTLLKERERNGERERERIEDGLRLRLELICAQNFKFLLSLFSLLAAVQNSTYLGFTTGNS